MMSPSPPIQNQTYATGEVFKKLSLSCLLTNRKWQT